MKKDVFTTSQAAKLCQVSNQVIVRAFDTGALKGFRVPNSKFRRIPRKSLIRFMKENNMRIPFDRVAVVSLDEQLISEFGKNRHKFKNQSLLMLNSECLFEIGVRLNEFQPVGIVIDLSSDPELVLAILKNIENGLIPTVDKIVGVSCCRDQALGSEYYSELLNKPIEIEQILSALDITS